MTPLVVASAWIIILLVSRSAVAQDSGSSTVDTFASIYLLGGGLLVAGVGMLAAWGIGRLKGTRGKEVTARFINLFSIGLQGAHARFKLELEAARDPSSPGGEKITEKEWQGIRDSMWKYLKDAYGSFNGIRKVVGLVTGVRTEVAVRALVDAKIDAGIADLDRLDKATQNPVVPAP